MPRPKPRLRSRPIPVQRLKLGLGTVQFGLDYGVSNKAGRTTLQEARSIVNAAAEAGVRVLDTARVYGESEEVLGRVLPRRHAFDIVTKLPTLLSPDGQRFDAAGADRLLADSLERLRQPAVYGLLLHRAGDLLSPAGDAVMAWLLRCKALGKVRKVGVSVYAEDDIAGLIARYPLDLVQAPVNVFDQRLLRGGALRACKERGVEVHARSVFLQGLLLMDREDVPDYFKPYENHLETYRLFLDRTGMSPVEAALSYVDGIEEVDAFVCGVNDRRQLLQLIASLPDGRRDLDYAPYAASDPALLNPANWKL